jgi:flavodoxin
LKKVLIAYFSATGNTETMANYIAEGVRFNGHEAVVRGIADIKQATDLEGYDGFALGSPTFSQDLPKPVKSFLSLVQGAKLEGKLGGAFGSYRHDASYRHDSFAPAIILDALEKQARMKPFELGALTLKEDVVESREGMKACQDYGKVFGEKLGG